MIREMISEFRKVIQEESELSPREIKAVCRVLPDAYYAEVRKRAVHTPAQARAPPETRLTPPPPAHDGGG